MKNTMLLLIISLMLPACGKKEAPAAPAPVVVPAPEAAPAAPAAPAEEKK